MTSDATHDGDEEAHSGFDPARALAAVRRRWRLALAAGLAMSLLSAFVVMSLPNRYEAAATVQIDPRRNKAAGANETTLSDLKPDTSTNVDNEIEIIRSRDVIVRAIEALRLRNDPEFNGTMGFGSSIVQRWRQLLSRVSTSPPAPPPGQADSTQAELDAITRLLTDKSPPATLDRDEITATVLEHTKVARVRSTALIDIRFTSQEAAKAARIANAIADAYIEQQLDLKMKASRQQAGMLEEKLQTLKIKVAEAERRVEMYKAEHGIFDSEGGQSSLTEKQLNRQLEQAVQARSQAAEARARFEQAQKLVHSRDGAATLGEVLQSNTIRQIKEQLANAQRRDAELKTRYGPNHPEMRKADADVREAQGALDDEVERVVANLKNDYEVSIERQRQAEAALAAAKSLQSTSKEAGVELKDLQRDAASSRDLYDAILARHKQLMETASLQLPDSRVVESAQIPSKPAFPKRRLLLVAAIVGSMLAGLAAVVGIELMAPGIDRAEDVEHVLEVEHLSSLPATAARGAAASDPLRVARLVVAEPGGAFAEAMRSLRREIDVRRGDSRPRVVLIASSLPGEGATETASNLAHHYALTGSNVLLVDGDLRRAGLSRLLAGTRANGLLETLATDLPGPQAVLRDAMTGLNFLPANGNAPTRLSAPELLASPRLGEVLAELKRHFDTIIVEAPPLLPVVDGRILADHADQIVFVLAWRRTKKQAARRALRLLGRNQRKVLGALVTEVDAGVLAEDQGYSASDLKSLRRAA